LQQVLKQYNPFSSKVKVILEVERYLHRMALGLNPEAGPLQGLQLLLNNKVKDRPSLLLHACLSVWTLAQAPLLLLPL
jgi:hypothetical protein